MPGLSKVIVLDADARASRQVQLGFAREGMPAAAAADAAALEQPGDGDDAGLVVIGGVDGQALELVRRARAALAARKLDTPIMFAGRGVRRGDAEAAGADEVVLRPAYLRDVVTIGRLLRGLPAAQRSHLAGSLVEVTGVLTLVRALAALGRSATLTLIRGLRRGEVRFYHGEVTSAHVGMSHGQAALHQLMLWTDARFDFHHEDVVRRQQIPLSREELFADAERFLESVRDSSGGLSPSVVLEQDIERVQSFGKQIPTEVYGVLRMFDGHRQLADVLEDSPYRVFETLRVAQRAVEVGLLRPIAHQPPRASWRAVLAIEDWLIGGEREPGPPPPPVTIDTSRDTEPMVAQDPRKPRKTRRNKKKKRTSAPVAASSGGPPPPDIDWGALVPRIVGAEVGSLSGVVPSSHISGEIIVAPPRITDGPPDPQPTIVFDDSASGPEPPASRASVAGGVAIAETTGATVVMHDLVTIESGATTARITAVPKTTVVVHAAPDEVSGANTQPIGAAPSAGASPAASAPAAAPAPTTTAPQAEAPAPATAASAAASPTAASPTADAPSADAPSADAPSAASPTAASPTADAPSAASPTAASPTAASPTADAPTADSPTTDADSPTADADADSPPPAADAAPAAAPVREVQARAARVIDVPITGLPAERDAAPDEVEDEPSDGVIRDHIATAQTAPVSRRRLPSDPPEEDDRPDVTMGEITTPLPRPTAEPRRSEPTILVADLAEIHAAVAEIASDRVTVPTSNAASPSREMRVSEVRGDAVAFSEVEEAFFRAGHEKDAVVTAPPMAESFDDLDEGYRPVGFWDRLRGKAPPKGDQSGPTTAPAAPPAADATPDAKADATPEAKADPNDRPGDK